MTGHNNSIQSQNPSFLTTLQATLEILDDISSVMPENTYLTLTNNLQQLYNIHTSSAPRTSFPSIIVPSIRVPNIDANYTSIALSSSISSTNYDVSSNYYVSANANNNNNNNNNNNIIHNSIINSLRENPIPNPMFGDYISNAQFT